MNFSEEYIFKVQLSEFNSQGIKMVYVYNQDKTIEIETEADDRIKILANGRLKFFMYGFVNENRKIELTKPAPWQKW